MRKGQATIFIIIGAIIVIGAFLLIYLFWFQKTSEIKIDTVPDKFKPIQTFVLSCLDNVMKDGILSLGSQGGYIYMDRFKKSALSTESDGIMVSLTYFIPYWWHLKSDNTCKKCMMSLENYPSLDSMQNELSRFIKEEMMACVGNFTSFSEQGFSVTALSTPSASVRIVPERVIAQLSYKLRAEKGKDIANLENFGAEKDVNLFRMHELASAITDKETIDSFLEEFLLDIIDISTALDEKRLPPFAAFEEGYSTHMWIKTNVMILLQKLMNSYVPFFKMENTKDSKGLYKYLILKNDKSYKDLEVVFMYMNWPIYFELTPSTGEIIRPRSIKSEFPTGMVPSIQTNHYEFFYDLSFPMMVEIRDEDGFGGEGYSLFFALEGNIRDNKNMEEWHLGDGTIGPWDYSRTSFSKRSSAPDEYPVDFVDNTTITKSVKIPIKTLFCEKEQRISRNIEINAFDSETKEPIPFAGLSFGCGKMMCSIGTTEKNGRAEEKLPVCMNGHLIIEKDGYLKKSIENLNITPDSFFILNTYMDRLQTLNAKAKVILIEDIENMTMSDLTNPAMIESVRSNSRDLLTQERAIINIIKEKETPYEPNFRQAIILVNSTAFDISPGTYSVSVQLLDEDGFIIPSEIRFYEDQEVQFPEINMTPALIGGAYLDNTTGFFEIPVQALHDSKNIEFYILRQRNPRTIDDLDSLGDTVDYSLRGRYLIEPGLS